MFRVAVDDALQGPKRGTSLMQADRWLFYAAGSTETINRRTIVGFAQSL
jgi:hypothetical protein